MEKKVHTTTITVYDRDASYQQVGELLHSHAKSILLRVGYPMDNHNTAIIFLILEMTTDELGALRHSVIQQTKRNQPDPGCDGQ